MNKREFREACNERRDKMFGGNIFKFKAHAGRSPSKKKAGNHHREGGLLCTIHQ